eukprot:NODE_2467_length_1415_cov_67.013932_g2347_i0.p1 GENE.NODE_2467_length_1415_cov_67.013932_g2347_i0~~NODE_2467_length_1415_cov_67.013932_g2347_i0.p1  ORF type:complete len:413 (+),score=28.91 NODE_2467_length_1415_cov_67.013932_g2347_i0:95-1333(+)
MRGLGGLALLLLLLSVVHLADGYIPGGQRFPASCAWNYTIRSIYGKTTGRIGLGDEQDKKFPPSMPRHLMCPKTFHPVCPKQQNTAPVPLCAPGAESEGCWMSRAHAVPLASRHIGGDVAAALAWPVVWMPTHCRYIRHNVSTIFQCSKRHHALKKKPLWIFFMGDSTTRGLYCELLRIFNGAERAWLPHGPCNDTNPATGRLGIVSMLTGEREFSYYCQESHIKVSWHYTYGLDNEKTTKLMANLLKDPDNAPTHIFFNSGAFDYDRFSRVLYRPDTIKKRPPNVMANALKGMRTTPAKRKKYMIQLLGQLKALNYKGHFWYRNNHCNVRFDARDADAAVEQLVKEANYRIINSYAFSLYRGVDLLHTDGFHYDQLEGSHKGRWRNKPHVGELSVLLAHSMMNAVCNDLPQ